MPAWRLLRLALILTWGLVVFVYAFPRELRPDWLSDLRRPVAKAMREAAIQPAHAVFSGAEGDRNRHLWAARFVGYSADGAAHTLEEWPEGMTWSTPTVGFDPLDTVWYRKLSKVRQIHLSRVAGTDGEAEAVARWRQGPRVGALLAFWCHSEFGRLDGLPPEAVALDVWFANQSYRTGAVRMSAARVGLRRCHDAAAETAGWEPEGPAPPWYRPTGEAP